MTVIKKKIKIITKGNNFQSMERVIFRDEMVVLTDPDMEYVLVKFYTLKEIFDKHRMAFFDVNGNLVITQPLSELIYNAGEYIDHLPPAYFCHIGREMHILKGSRIEVNRNFIKESL